MTNNRGWSRERQREYEELVEEFEEEGRYEGREEEVAARIVNKQRREYGESQEAKAEDRKGESPDRHLPLENYDHLTVEEVTDRLDEISAADVRQIREYERDHKDRRTLLEQLDRCLDG